MRILHTSDWHLGQNFYAKSRQAEHQAFFNWLIEQCQEQHLDAIIVAGDIFDTGSPPSYARSLLNQFIDQLQNYDCQLIILAGNHDSVAMLNESKALYARLNSQLIANVSQQDCHDFNDQVITLTNKQGQPSVQLCAVPFIRPRDVLVSQTMAEEKNSKATNLMTAIQSHYQQIYSAAEQKNKSLGKNLPIIATGHLTIVNASVTDSVREIYIGTLEAFPASAFPNFDYLALGHIHQAQTIAKKDNWRYSGSPIPMSFDEAKREKSVVLVEFSETDKQAEHSPSRIELLTVPCFQPMQSLKGNLEQIKQQLDSLVTTDLKSSQSIWLDIEVDSSDYHSDVQKQIELICADYPVEILLVRRSKQKQVKAEIHSQESLDELEPEQVFAQKLAEAGLEQADEVKLNQLFKLSLAQLNLAETELEDGLDNVNNIDSSPDHKEKNKINSASQGELL